mmetsp:Transcript_107823/g.304843  ORF Transcript_107823/g.304843 Transcript_107823/m.304843 type:complete len:118 (-) Transcript_107823:41-394(-)
METLLSGVGAECRRAWPIPGWGPCACGGGAKDWHGGMFAAKDWQCGTGPAKDWQGGTGAAKDWQGRTAGTMAGWTSGRFWDWGLAPLLKLPAMPGWCWQAGCMLGGYWRGCSRAPGW